MFRSLLGLVTALALFVPTPSFAAWAVALGSTGSPVVTRFTLPDEAKQNALDGCKAHFQNCHVVASGESGCVAFAPTGPRWGVAQAGSAKRADAAALAQCQALDAGACKVVNHFCGR